ncbi:Group II intron-encoded protein LtrA [termite gut metagenome]|uniref:Group II intron-encoded protein LtrA n=1 Tax=termite gut metagenome TaxID=433724 RepID=A0A5J4PP68_9ZZZZ
MIWKYSANSTQKYVVFTITTQLPITVTLSTLSITSWLTACTKLLQESIYQTFYNKGFKRKKIAGEYHSDNIPQTVTITGGRNSLIARLKLWVCELCGATGNLEMHHVRKLKDLKGKSDWEKRMIARRRKTLAVCSKCHDKIDFYRHTGLN